MFSLPQYKRVEYEINPQTGYYAKSLKQPLKTPVMRLPFELRIVPTQAEQIKCNARELMVSRELFKTGSYKFITGLQASTFQNWYVGNDYENLKGKKVLSMILFHLWEGNSKLTVYYFSRYDKETTALRLQFASNIIPLLLNSEVLETRKAE